MKKRFSITVAVLVMLAFAGGYLANSVVGQRGVSAASPSTTVKLTSSTSPASSAAIEKAYGVASKSVVFVETPGVGTGSGIIYDQNGDIVTNAHVVSGGKTFRITLSNGKKLAATLVGKDTSDDLAVLHVNATGLTPATFARKGAYQVAESVLAIGSPLGLQDSVTSGLISGINRTQQEPNGAYIPNSIQTSAAINPGNSGGALVDLNGDVVGIPTMVQTSTTGNEPVQDVGFAIPSYRVVDIANQIVATGKVEHTGRAFLGISVGDSSSQSGPFGGFYGRTTSVSGAVVNRLTATGPAGKAGIRQGDVITKVNGTTISSADDLLAALATMKPGQTVSVTFNRNGSNHTVSVQLGELPANQ